MIQSRHAKLWLVVYAAVGLGGCGGNSMTASLGLPSPAQLPELPKIDLPKIAAAPASSTYTKAGPVEAYEQVARGATSCWFGAGGQLKASHIFYADADPPSAGSKAEIALVERDPAAVSSRGSKAYRISLRPEGEGTRIEHTNLKLADALVGAVQADVHRFSEGDLACASSGPLAPKVEAVAAVTTPKAKTKPQATPAKR